MPSPTEPSDRPLAHITAWRASRSTAIVMRWVNSARPARSIKTRRAVTFARHACAVMSFGSFLLARRKGDASERQSPATMTRGCRRNRRQLDADSLVPSWRSAFRYGLRLDAGYGRPATRIQLTTDRHRVHVLSLTTRS